MSNVPTPSSHTSTSTAPAPEKPAGRDVAVHPLTLVSLCDGYAGTELALRSVAQVRTVARVERDAYAAAILVERMGQARLDSCPIWDDLITFDGAAWRGRVDIVAAGFPCQPFSTVGTRGGTDDDRWLWPDIARIIADVEPGFVLLENVGQLVAHGLPEILCALAALGFDAEWGLLAASAVGAPHRRERFWLAAHRPIVRRGERLNGSLTSGLPADAETESAADVGYADGERRPEVARSTPSNESPHGWRSNRTDLTDSPGQDVAHTTGLERREPDHQERPEPRDDTRPDARRGGFPPRPDDHDGWADWITQGGPQPVLRRHTDGPPPGLADALHLGGNGLVPQCAAHAWAQLIERGGLT